VVACAAAPVSPPAPEDPVVEQARALLVAMHPAGDRLVQAALPAGGSRADRIEALLAALGDPSTRLLGPEAWKSFLAEVSGEPTVGVGLRELLDLDLAPDGRVLVITTQPGGPAARAGLGPGDVLERIDGQPVRGLTEAMSRLRGAAGAEVSLTLLARGEERTVRLRREALPAAGTHVHAGLLDDGVLHLAVDGFSAGTAGAVERALLGAGERGVVLDLRNNPGGAVDAVLAVAGLFLGDRDIARALGRTDRPVLRSAGTARVRGRVAVVVNEGTASAAELLAAALHDAGGARIIGQRTAGKALVHVTGALDDGSVLLISAARLVRLDGTEILGRGLTPDDAVAWAGSVGPPLDVPGRGATDPQLAAAEAGVRTR
jgi:carboxyl-terminal processing protease